MTNNCSPQTFKNGLKALGERISNLKSKHVMEFVATFVIMVVFVLVFFSCLHALITLMGLARIYLFSLPIDTSSASFWMSSSDGSRDHVFWAGYVVFEWLVIIGFVGILSYIGCRAICEIGRPEAKDDVAASEVAD